jgi:hypothetical protein
MAGALTILLFVAVGEGTDPTTRAMVHATREALGAGAKVEVREAHGELTDDEAVIAEQLAGADAVVDLVWTDPAHRSAMLHVHIARTGRWIGRSIGFMASDASTERGRTIGFTVVSMLPEQATEPATPPETQPTLASSDPSAKPPSAPSEEIVEQDRALRATGVTPTPSVQPIRPSFALDLFALGAWGVGGEGAGGGGGGLAISWFPVTHLSVRLGGSLRAGAVDVDGTQPSTLTAALSTGFGWHPMRPTLSHPFGIALRVDYLALYESLRQAPNTFEYRWLSGLGAVADLSWLLSADIEVMGGLGLEEAFGSTNVQVQASDQIVANFPPLHVIGEAGLRVRF